MAGPLERGPVPSKKTFVLSTTKGFFVQTETFTLPVIGAISPLSITVDNDAADDKFAGKNFTASDRRP